jgi:hypothetical protein
MNNQGTNSILKLGLLGNAGFSLATGITLLVAGAPIARWIGIHQPLTLALIGLLLIPFAAHLWIAARRHTVNRREILYFCAMDALWIVASIVLLITGMMPFTTAGNWTVALVALFVMDFFLLQVIGLARTSKPVSIR